MIASQRREHHDIRVGNGAAPALPGITDAEAFILAWIRADQPGMDGDESHLVWPS